jgi:8-oxo-dGTP pyrophosphatase MutT (NUDIX family)
MFPASNLRRLIALNQPLGWIEEISLPFLLSMPNPPVVSGESVTLSPELCPAEVAAWLGQVALQMRDAGVIKGWRNELYTVFANDAAGNLDLNQPLFELERASFRRFGLTSRAVHINGYTSEGGLWIARRAANKAIDPNLLDNLAAGGIAAGETEQLCMIRELAEEAGIPQALAQTAQACGAIRTIRAEPDGTHDEILYMFDLLLPAGFVPHNTDGEVAGFKHYAFQDIAAISSDMTQDAAAVTQSFLVRHGIL